jgi:hypothetical protein
MHETSEFVHLASPPGAQYVTLQKYFSHRSLVIYFFPTPCIKLKLEQKIGGSSVSSFF